VNADEAISSLSRCFLLCRWLFFVNQPLFSLLEAIGSAYFKRVTLLSLHGRPASCDRLSDFFLCLAHSLESIRFSVEFSHMKLHGSFQDLRQGDASVTTYMQHTKSLFDELNVVGQPLSLEDFNLYIFCGLYGEFKDLVTSHVTKAKQLSYADLHNHLLTHEFLHKTSLSSLAANPPLLPTPSLLPSAHLA